MCKYTSHASITQTSTLSDVPDYADGWENDFIIPSQYSENTMAALRSKRIGDKHRHEIVQEICSRMINFCKYPTSKQCNIVAAKLVQKFPQLRDTKFTCGHVSNNNYNLIH